MSTSKINASPVINVIPTDLSFSDLCFKIQLRKYPGESDYRLLLPAYSESNPNNNKYEVIIDSNYIRVICTIGGSSIYDKRVALSNT